MKLSVSEAYDIVLEEVFNSVVFRTKGGQTLSVCIRDDGFDVSINGVWHTVDMSAKTFGNPIGEAKEAHESMDRYGIPRKVYSEDGQLSDAHGRYYLAPLVDRIAKWGEGLSQSKRTEP